MQALLEPNPAKRGHADDLAKSNWLLERPVCKMTMSARGGKGQVTIFEAFMGGDVLAYRGDHSAGKGAEGAVPEKLRKTLKI